MGKQDDGQIGVVTALVRSSFLVNAVYAESGREHGLTPQQGDVFLGRWAQEIAPAVREAI